MGLPIDFDFDVTNLDVDVQVDEITLLDPDNTPNRVLPDNQAFKIRIRWTEGGDQVLFFTGKWDVTASVESIGTGFEGLLTTTPASIVAPAPPHARTDTLTVDPATAGAGAALVPGVYRLILRFAFTPTDPTAPRIGGFAEGPLFELETGP